MMFFSSADGCSIGFYSAVTRFAVLPRHLPAHSSPLAVYQDRTFEITNAHPATPLRVVNHAKVHNRDTLYLDPEWLQSDLRSHQEHYKMAICTVKPGDWKVKVDFKSKSVLQANASGVLPVPPEDALAMVTDKAGDSLFRVVQRTALPPMTEGTQLVEVVNKAAIRILCWKLWTINRVKYEISTASGALQVTSASSTSSTTSAVCQACTGGCCCSRNNPPNRVSFNLESSNVLNSLSGTWSFEAINIPRSTLQQASRSSHCYASTASNQKARSIQRNSPLRSAASAPEQQQQLQQGLNMLAIDSSIAERVLHSNKDRPSSVNTVDKGEMIAGTLVRYEQLAQPKGLPPGMRFVPGLSDAVRASIGREVRQMLDKITYAADLEVHLGLTPQQALTLMTQQLEQAGGSFRKVAKNGLMLEASSLIHDNLSAPRAIAVGSNFRRDGMRSSSGVHQRRMSGAHSVVEAGAGHLVPQLDVQPLEMPVIEASGM